MSNLYGSSQITSIDEIANSDELMGLFLTDDVLRGTEEQIKEFCESEEAQILIEKQVLNKPTLHRMSKADDLKRRTKLCAYYLAKDTADFAKLVKFQKLKKMYANKILQKFGRKAELIAKAGQKKYIKTARSLKATAAEKKAQSAR